MHLISVSFEAFLHAMHGSSLEGTVRLFSLKKCCKLAKAICRIKIIAVYCGPLLFNLKNLRIGQVTIQNSG